MFKFSLNIRKPFFWNMLSRELVESPSLETVEILPDLDLVNWL